MPACWGKCHKTASVDTGYGTFLIKENHTGRSLWALWGQGELPRTDQHAQKSKAIQILPSFFVGSPPGDPLAPSWCSLRRRRCCCGTPRPEHGGYSGASARIHDSDPGLAYASICIPKRMWEGTVGINPHNHRTRGESWVNLWQVETASKTASSHWDTGRYPPPILVGVSINEILKLSFPGWFKLMEQKSHPTHRFVHQIISNHQPSPHKKTPWTLSVLKVANQSQDQYRPITSKR